MALRGLKTERVGSRVLVSGHAQPDQPLTVENLSAAPFAPSDHPDTLTRTRTDALGRFRVPVSLAQPGDVVRVAGANHTRRLLKIRLPNQVDQRRAEEAHQGLRLVPAPRGAWAFTNVRKNNRLAEPGAVVEFRNHRTGAVWQYKLNVHGQLPPRARLTGEPGDVFKLHVTDGVNNQWMGEDAWGALVAPGLPEPPLPLDVPRTGVRWRQLKGPLFVNGPQPKDCVQSPFLGNCYFTAVAAALARTSPQRLRDMFRENANGTVTVTFQRYDHHAGVYVPEAVTVTRKVPYRGGVPMMGADDGNPAAEHMENWYPLLEKAYAQWKGGYDATWSGYPNEMFEAFLGAEGRHLDPQGYSLARMWRALKRRDDHGIPMVCWTRVSDPPSPMIAPGIRADHAHTVLGVDVRDGVAGVVLRNPWGNEEPARNGTRDGLFWIPMTQFMECMAGVGMLS